MHIAEPFLEPDDGLAVGRKTEMSGLDDPRMHGADRDLVQRLAFHGQEAVNGRAGVGAAVRSERMSYAPYAMVQPGSRVGETHGLEAIEIADGALQPDRRRMQLAHRRKNRLLDGEHEDLRSPLIEQRHMHGVLIPPKTEQRHPRLHQILDRRAPDVLGDDHARPGAMTRNLLALLCDVAQRAHDFPSGQPRSFATFWNHVTSGPGRYTPAVNTSARCANIGT